MNELAMTIALQELGYGEIYHMRSAYASERDVELWIQALEAKYEGKGAPFARAQWDSIFGDRKVGVSKRGFSCR